MLQTCYLIISTSLIINSKATQNKYICDNIQILQILLFCDVHSVFLKLCCFWQKNQLVASRLELHKIVF